MFVFDTAIINLGIGLLGLILINILLGSITSIIEKRFDKAKFIQGLVKGIVVIVSFVGVFAIGVLNPNVLVLSMNGQDVNLITGINLIVLAGYLFYGKQVLTKLSSFVHGNFDVVETVVPSQPVREQPTQPQQ